MAAAATYEPVGTPVTLGSGQATVEFTDISGAYTDLVLILALQRASGATDAYIKFNDAAGTAYSMTTLSGNGSSASSGRQTNGAFAYIDSHGYPPASPNFNTVIINIMNYSNTTTFKTFISRSNSAATGLDAIVGMWRSTAAINKITIGLDGGSNLNTGSTFSLYGIKAA